MFDHSDKQIYLVCGSTDMRKGIEIDLLYLTFFKKKM